ncbi:type II/IV secretion system protein [Candidatus Uhrbacteria bacterium]|nr:type II/IV secretion system protein [Candidatus Uhrbacteria bacterium]
MSSNLPSIADLLQRRREAQSAPTPAAAPAVSSSPAPAVAPAPSPAPAPAAPAAPEPAPSVPSSQKIVLSDVETSEKLTEKMGAIKLREKEDETQRLAASLGAPYIDLKGFPISPDALVLIPEEQSRELKAVVFLFTGTELRIGAVDPANKAVKDLAYSLGERHKANAAVYAISEQSLAQALTLYAALPKITQVVKGVQITEKELEKYQEQMKDMKAIADVLNKANVTDVLAVVIAASVELGSSDVHIEAEESGIAVRFRVDGMLQEVTKLEPSKWQKIINRIKLIASLKLNVTDQAQDGRFTIFQKNKQIDVRTSTIPTAHGESVVMRLLNPDSISLAFDELGFRAPMLKKLTKEIEKPNGMIITTGPTGSGKTTTLYAILKRLNTSDVKIITLEDPIEYKVEGLNQSQIDASKDYTFAKGLRSILRQDPDIVMVGEIRDLETAEIAIQASLTGHLMLSTIHTNDAAGAVPRFLSMGVKPYLLAPALNAIMGQRLVRKLCKDCKKEVTLEPDVLEDVKKLIAAIPENSGETKPDVNAMKFYGPAGCATCGNTGYKGRVGVYEIIIRDAELEKMIVEGGVITEFQMREVAARQGMVSMAQDGILKALEGLTAVEEVKRIVGLS